MPKMKKAYIKPETWATKPLYEKPLLSESNDSKTGTTKKYTNNNPDEDEDISFNSRRYNVWNTWDE